jgi:hypothetical protein
MFGTTARYARTLRNRAVANMFLVAFVSFPVSAWWADNLTSPYRVVVTFAAAAVLLATVYDLSGAYRRAHAGIVSEQRTLAAIRDSAVSVVVNGAKLADRSGDIDHVALGPVAAVIETKTGSGTVTVQGDQLRCNTRVLKGASLRHVQSQARSVSRVLGVEVAPIVCVVDMVGGPLHVKGVTICGVDDLADVLDALPVVLDADVAVGFGEQLAGRA